MAQKSLARNTFIVALGTMLSRILGLWREILISASFGATWVTDSFLIAYTIPNLLRRLFAEGALSTSVIPIFSQYNVQNKKDSREALQFIASVFSGLTLVVSLICLIGIIASPAIVYLVGIGFRDSPEQMLLTTRLTQIMFPFLLLISWAALAMGVLNSLLVFSWSAVAPVFFNLGIIASLYLLQDILGPYCLAVGVLLGGLGQFVVQVIPLRRLNFPLRFKWFFWIDPGFKKLFRLMLPVSFALAVSQINTLVDRVIASTCREGAVSALYFSDRLMELPLGVLGIAVSTVILPALSQEIHRRNINQWKATLSQGMRFVVFIMFPVSLFIIIFRTELVQLVYQRGLFDSIATDMTTQALFFYTFGLPFLALVHIYTKAFYSLQDTQTPVKISVMMVGVNIVLDLLLVQFLDFGGLALATSLTAILHFICLGFFLKRNHFSFSLDNLFLRWMGKVALQIVLFLFLAFGFAQWTEGWKGIVPSLLILTIIGIGLALFYLFLSFMFKLEEVEPVKSLLTKIRFRIKLNNGEDNEKSDLED
ncbi:MAG: putative peptidoglycan lipid flippase [Candidatus Atribacteria bacterium]|nr:putative peptidoglycan lipid flippase [Candidatus Atribacteria bacterium]